MKHIFAKKNSFSLLPENPDSVNACEILLKRYVEITQNGGFTDKAQTIPSIKKTGTAAK